MDMKEYKEYIDNETMVTMAQMDKPSKIFDYLYLVRAGSPPMLRKIMPEFPKSRISHGWGYFEGSVWDLRHPP